MDLSIIIPTLNEAAAAPALVSRLKALFSAEGVAHEILIADGGSTDKTQELARAAGAEILSCPELGYGPAFRQGLAAARGEFILTIDGDGSHPPESALELWKLRTDADLVIASRYVPGGSAQMPFIRLALSKILNFLTRVFFGFPVRDASGGLRLYRACLLKSFATEAMDFSIQQEALVRMLKAGAVVKEIPFRFRPRIGGRSKASALGLGLSYLRLFFKMRYGPWSALS